MNWRSDPCCSRGVPAPSSSAVFPRVFTIALKLKPAFRLPTVPPPAMVARSTCSAVMADEASSEVAAFWPP